MACICLEKFSQRAKAHSNEEAYFEKKGTQWQPTSWGVYYNNCQSLARGFIELGLSKGGRVCILGSNRPEWTTACVAAQMSGGVSAGIYTACSAEEVEYIVNHAEAELLVIEDESRFESQVKPVLEKLTSLKKVILMESGSETELVVNYQSILEQGESAPPNELEDRCKAIEPNQLATLIYTSGTTGPPKAVMLSHENLRWTIHAALQLIHIGEGDVMLSYLPLAHIAEQMFTIYAPQMAGVQIYYAESMEKLAENLQEVQPTVVFGVPRVFEKIHEKLAAKMSQATGIKKVLLDQARSAGMEVWDTHHKSKIMSPLLKFRYELSKKLIYDKVKPLIGLKRARFCISGAAPISRELIEFFMGLDIPIYEVYGQSEDSGPATFNIPGATRLGTVGRPLPGIQLKIADDGEILVKGPSVFMGYFKAPEATDEVLKDGWLYSGDVGEITQEGYLKITDRKKDLLITAGGKNIAPQNLEGMLKQISLISSAVVVGDRKKYLAALLTPNAENIQRFADNEGLDSTNEGFFSNQKLLAAIEADVKKMNMKLAPVEQIKKFKLLDHDFTVESGELTPTMKVKRKVVNQKYQTEIEGLYQ